MAGRRFSSLPPHAFPLLRLAPWPCRLLLLAFAVALMGVSLLGPAQAQWPLDEPPTNRPGSDPADQQFRTFKLQFITARQLTHLLERQFPNQLKIVPDGAKNCVLVRGPAELVNQAAMLVERLDRDALPAVPGATAEELQGDADQRVDSDLVKKLEAKLGEVTRKRDELGRRVRSLPSGDPGREAALKALEAAVAEAFDLEQALLLAEIAELRRQARTRSQTLKDRQERRQSLVDQELRDLISGRRSPLRQLRP